MYIKSKYKELLDIEEINKSNKKKKKKWKIKRAFLKVTWIFRRKK